MNKGVENKLFEVIFCRTFKRIIIRIKSIGVILFNRPITILVVVIYSELEVLLVFGER